jgi:hypothetical protein
MSSSTREVETEQRRAVKCLISEQNCEIFTKTAGAFQPLQYMDRRGIL